jgi:hypothetical protein
MYIAQYILQPLQDDVTVLLDGLKYGFNVSIDLVILE